MPIIYGKRPKLSIILVAGLVHPEGWLVAGLFMAKENSIFFK
jgi:hypothetical protein